MFGQITAITIWTNIHYDIYNIQDIVTTHPSACLPKNTQKYHLICFVLLLIDAIKEFGSFSYSHHEVVWYFVGDINLCFYTYVSEWVKAKFFLVEKSSLDDSMLT